ncbi:hypothetical protein PAN31117_03100 [Pandoraea anapnoica]|uniref:Uncharacterized protein n=1 Tax=Pandoraea anapnoica TaxID=2508301 RepID=A0A5E5A726_9BURK|nr:hypothetical protein [Pandoraea anapnoica]VVE68867.1 hypothetical protein PAN31117_03100 [Pandoraea anapnoica]
MSRYAIIVDDVVVNVVIWDGETRCADIPEDAVELPESSAVAPGYTVESGVFVAPPTLDLPLLLPAQ